MSIQYYKSDTKSCLFPLCIYHIQKEVLETQQEDFWEKVKMKNMNTISFFVYDPHNILESDNNVPVTNHNYIGFIQLFKSIQFSRLDAFAYRFLETIFKEIKHPEYLNNNYFQAKKYKCITLEHISEYSLPMIKTFMELFKLSYGVAYDYYGKIIHSKSSSSELTNLQEFIKQFNKPNNDDDVTCSIHKLNKYKNRCHECDIEQLTKLQSEIKILKESKRSTPKPLPCDSENEKAIIHTVVPMIIDDENTLPRSRSASPKNNNSNRKPHINNINIDHDPDQDRKKTKIDSNPLPPPKRLLVDDDSSSGSDDNDKKNKKQKVSIVVVQPNKKKLEIIRSDDDDDDETVVMTKKFSAKDKIKCDICKKEKYPDRAMKLKKNNVVYAACSDCVEQCACINDTCSGFEIYDEKLGKKICLICTKHKSDSDKAVIIYQ